MKDLIFINAKVIGEDKIVEEGYLKLKDGIIVEFGEMAKELQVNEGSNIIDLQGDYLSPGIIDIHTHGAGGSDIMDGNFNAFRIISEAKASQGVTALLATTLTASHQRLKEVSQKLNSYLSSKDNLGNIIGLHLEGPYINGKKKGAQREDQIRPPRLNEVKELYDVLGDKLKLVTLAPEIKGSKEVIKYLVAKGVVVGAGHSNASEEEVKESFKWGLDHGTHLFNGMRALHHREPGVLGALLLDEEATVEIIADGHHLHPSIIEMVFKLKKMEKIIPVSDSIRASDMEDGVYDLGGQEVKIKGGIARLESGNLAGSTTELRKSLKNIIEITGLELVQAIKLISLNPARRLNIDDKKGSIKVGKDADLTILNSKFKVKGTFIEGREVYNCLNNKS
ncbi:N-acetylglucosamine-6-phosphate deacetylase [Halonatronum saccharophilum]|uniref:N-acetylglucosamine-6-phosphate deacetylase n=1 Tax=Halonatronum saccharophilum TaxID=150060 RepID=UPI000487CBA8|nr:N-acetylglucosamine-6-phosphate deacetylase [Halonatronum saccharophilum]